MVLKWISDNRSLYLILFYNFFHLFFPIKNIKIIIYFNLKMKFLNFINHFEFFHDFPIKVPWVTKRNPWGHCDKVPWAITRNSLKAHYGVYKSKLHLNTILQRSSDPVLLDVPLGKPVMYHVTLCEVLR